MLTLLLPPSEGKADGGSTPRWRPGSGRFRRLAEPRRAVAEALAAVDGGSPKLLGASGDLHARAAAANRSVIGARTLPAHDRFTGVVWEHLDPTGLTAAGLERARESVLVLSAVTGVSAWADPVPDFRLKLSVSLPPMGRLDRFWRPWVSDLIDRRGRGHTVIDLLPNEHRAAWTPSPGSYELVRPVLSTPDGKPAGHGGKAAKGLLARALLESDDVERTLATFDPSPLILEIDRPQSA